MTQGAAWAAPVVVMGGLAPRIAASPNQDCVPNAAKSVTYAFGDPQTGTPILSGLFGSARPFSFLDSRRISTFPRTLTVCAAPGNSCTIPAGTVVARLRANLTVPSGQDNNAIEVHQAGGLGSQADDSEASGYETTLVTTKRLVPGDCEIIQLSYVAKSFFVYTGSTNLSIELTARQPASGNITATQVSTTGTRSTVGVL